MGVVIAAIRYEYSFRMVSELILRNALILKSGHGPWIWILTIFANGPQLAKNSICCMLITEAMSIRKPPPNISRIIFLQFKRLL